MLIKWHYIALERFWLAINKFYLAHKGFQVYGIDFSETSIKWGKQLAKEKSIELNFICQSIFDFQCEPESCDFIYDSGCFHHIKPHRRSSYLNTILKFLKPDGYFAMTCFTLDGGANISDYDVYRDQLNAWWTWLFWV